MSMLTESRYLFVFVYLWQLLAALYRAIYWFVIQRTSRISRLACKLEQLNAREQDLSLELARLNEEYLAKSSQIQARRNSNALERAKVLEELAQCSQLNGIVKAVPVVKCDAPVLKAPKVKVTPSTEKVKPKPVEEKKKPNPALQRSTSLTVAEPSTPTIRARSKSPLLASRSLIFERPRTPDILIRTPVMLTRKTIPPSVPEESAVKLAPKENEEKEVSCEQTNSSFSKLTGFNLANHRVNEYIDLVLDSTLSEFRSCDDDRSPGNKRSQRFRATIKELYGDPEWRPFINDLKQQYKLFYYL